MDENKKKINFLRKSKVKVTKEIHKYKPINIYPYQY